MDQGLFKLLGFTLKLLDELLAIAHLELSKNVGFMSLHSPFTEVESLCHILITHIPFTKELNELTLTRRQAGKIPVTKDWRQDVASNNFLSHFRTDIKHSANDIFNSQQDRFAGIGFNHIAVRTRRQCRVHIAGRRIRCQSHNSSIRTQSFRRPNHVSTIQPFHVQVYQQQIWGTCPQFPDSILTTRGLPHHSQTRLVIDQ